MVKRAIYAAVIIEIGFFVVAYIIGVFTNLHIDSGNFMRDTHFVTTAIFSLLFGSWISPDSVTMTVTIQLMIQLCLLFMVFLIVFWIRKKLTSDKGYKP
jgi:hypothetical protein